VNSCVHNRQTKVGRFLPLSLLQTTNTHYNMSLVLGANLLRSTYFYATLILHKWITTEPHSQHVTVWAWTTVWAGPRALPIIQKIFQYFGYFLTFLVHCPLPEARLVVKTRCLRSWLHLWLQAITCYCIHTFYSGRFWQRSGSNPAPFSTSLLC
jgi:hypothetical protein